MAMRLQGCVHGEAQACSTSKLLSIRAAPLVKRPSHSFLGASSLFLESRPATNPARSRTVTVGAHRRSTCAVAAADAPQPTAAHPTLASLDLLPVVNLQGYILPDVPEGTEATVFGIYDQSKTLQYIGFSKDLRSSLRTVFGRRPDKCHWYRALHLPRLDQDEMVGIRSAWFDQNAGPPAGNKLPKERTAWQLPASCFTISDRGKAAAAEEMAKQMLVKIRTRGCKEDFIPIPDLILEGKIDFMAADALSAEEVERQRVAEVALAKATRNCTTTLDGETVPFDLLFTATMKTNGGYMFDVRVTFQERETLHRVIVGKDYYSTPGLDAEGVIERVFAFLLRKGVPRRTEGMLISSQFPSNYFSVSELHQFFADFEDEFEDGLPGDEKFWRFNRTQDYGHKGKNEDVEALSRQFRLD